MKLHAVLIATLIIWMYFVAVNLARADFPPNNLSYPENAQFKSNVTKAKVDQAVKLVRQHYAPIMQTKLGCRLQIVNNWASPEVNAYAERRGSVCSVEFLGGFARVPDMTYGAVMDVLCHEVGHHMGGAPRYNGGSWASCEGQSDYWAQKCMKKILGAKVALESGLVLGRVLASFGGEPVPRYETPDRSLAWGVYCSHPEAQCRVDTYLAGVKRTARPKCWYNPRASHAL